VHGFVRTLCIVTFLLGLIPAFADGSERSVPRGYGSQDFSIICEHYNELYNVNKVYTICTEGS